MDAERWLEARDAPDDEVAEVPERALAAKEDRR
jgi:hypothetical protein